MNVKLLWSHRLAVSHDVQTVSIIWSIRATRQTNKNPMTFTQINPPFFATEKLHSIWWYCYLLQLTVSFPPHLPTPRHCHTLRYCDSVLGWWERQDVVKLVTRMRLVLRRWFELCCGGWRFFARGCCAAEEDGGLSEYKQKNKENKIEVFTNKITNKKK